MSRHQIFPETDLLRTRKATSFRFNPNLPSNLHVNDNPLNLAVYDAHHLMSYSQRAHMRESKLARDDSGKDLTEEFWRNDPASHLVPSEIQNRYSTKTTEGILGRAPQKASLQMLSEFARHMPTSKRPDFRQIKALCRVMQMSKDGKTVIPNFIEAFEPFVKGEEKLEINFQIETSQNQPEFADVTQAMSRTLSEDLKKLWGKEVIQQWQAVDIKDFYLANRLALHLNVLRRTDYLPLNRMNSYLFQMLCDSWKTAWQDLIKMQYWARQYLGEAEGMRRVWTLSLQILQHTIMERWKNVKKKLLIQDEDSSSPVNKIEKAYQLATPNIDLIYIIENFPPTKILEDKIGEQQTVSLLLNNAMGTRQVYARIQDARYLKGYKGSLLKSLSHNMAQAAEKLGLNVCRVLAVSEALRLEFKEDSSALVFQKSIANIIKMLENEMFEVKDTFFQWYDSPERGWLIQTFQDRYQQRLNLLCEQKVSLEEVDGGPCHGLITWVAQNLDSPDTVKVQDVLRWNECGLDPGTFKKLLMALISKSKKNKPVNCEAEMARLERPLTEQQKMMFRTWFVNENIEILIGKKTQNNQQNGRELKHPTPTYSNVDGRI